MQDLFWKFFYSRWSARKDFDEGYTILAMVPGDLPVFLKIAMRVLATQKTEKLREILVIPDHATKEILRVFQSIKEQTCGVPIRLVRLSFFDELITRTLKNPWHNNWLQFIRGVNHASTRHILWHDSDLFILNPSFLEEHYRQCAGQACDVLGVSPVWDAWYGENGFSHLVSTWEIMFDTKWARRFRPWQHHGHEFVLEGKRHVSDITLLPQCLTPPSQIMRNERAAASFVHFNHVIGTCRQYQKCKDVFHDDGFRILLIRLLVDMFDPQGQYPSIPSVQECAAGLFGTNERITYSGETARQNFPEFRKKLEELLNSPFVDGPMRTRAADILAPFDKEFLGAGGGRT